MKDIEYSIIDELYFVSSFKELIESTNLSPDKLKKEIQNLIQKGWVTLFDKNGKKELKYVIDIFEQNFKSYYYLATKKGLLKHNTI